MIKIILSVMVLIIYIDLVRNDSLLINDSKVQLVYFLSHYYNSEIIPVKKSINLKDFLKKNKTGTQYIFHNNKCFLNKNIVNENNLFSYSQQIISHIGTFCFYDFKFDFKDKLSQKIIKKKIFIDTMRNLLNKISNYDLNFNVKRTDTTKKRIDYFYDLSAFLFFNIYFLKKYRSLAVTYFYKLEESIGQAQSNIKYNFDFKMLLDTVFLNEKPLCAPPSTFEKKLKN